MKKTWFALTSTALLVTGVVAAGPALARLSESTAGTGGPSATEPGAASRPASSTAAKPRWAGTKQFLEVRSGATRNGVVTLAARPAKKVILGESFETQPIPGPYTDVTLVPNARILLLDGESGTPEAFLEDLRKRPADQRSEAFDLTFNAKGQVTQVEWLYVP